MTYGYCNHGVQRRGITPVHDVAGMSRVDVFETDVELDEFARG